MKFFAYNGVAYRQDFPFTGYPLKTEVYTHSDQGPGLVGLLSRAENSWQLVGWNGSGTAPAAPYRPFIARSQERVFGTRTDLSRADKLTVSTQPVKSIITTQLYDDYNRDGKSDSGHFYGNPTDITVETRDGNNAVLQKKITVNHYGDAAWERQMGRLSRTQGKKGVGDK